jgi:hypothetical protein
LADVAAARAEVVDILAGAIFTFLLKGDVRPAGSGAETHSAPVPT